ncbi:extracellular catalytic domain type 1 short-chain-length polyhydroxyalkanoate depolymerase [Halioxenophilus aromaticivorans]|uniref:PHB depolymerase family esterase n=1 Tax=Halioxenophilus aromaticivorans TaxID=1306992 RepID=A0AAV3U2B2_9ALTE
MKPPLLKTARSAWRHLFGNNPPSLKTDSIHDWLKDALGSHAHNHQAPQAASAPTPSAEGNGTSAETEYQPANDVEARHGVFSFRQLTPKRLDCRFKAQSHKGSRDRDYRLFIPSNYQNGKAMPLVMVLHGCHQTNLDIAKIANLDQIAEQEGFLVVYPFVSSYTGLRAKNCWAWWQPAQTRAGQGEVADLNGILDEVCEHYTVDSSRIHVAGLSSGAGMAVALMVTQSERIASGCAVAGVAYGESAQAVQLFQPIPTQYRPVAKLVKTMEAQMPAAKTPVPLMIVHSRDDEVVPIKAAKNLRDSWAACFGISLHRKARVESGQTGASGWRFARYRGQSPRQHIETWWLDGPGHGWYGGKTGKFSYPNALNVSQRMWHFFKHHHITGQ